MVDPSYVLLHQMPEESPPQTADANGTDFMQQGLL